MSPLLLSAAEIARAAPLPAEIVSLVEATYRMEANGEADVPPKIGVHPGAPQNFLHAMPAWVGGARALGMKWVSYFPQNSAGGRPDSTGIVVLNDPDSGIPVAIMEGMWITYARTGACAALAAKYLAGDAPRRLGLIGCGGLGQWSLRMIGAVLPSVEEVFVASKRLETRQSFCTTMAKEGPWRLTPVDDVRGAVERMDIIVSSVPKLQEHPVRGRWWSPGSVMIPLYVTGAWDDEVYQMADRMACDGPANLKNALDRYRPNLAIDPVRMVAIQDLAAGRSVARRVAGDRVLAFITGNASLDIVLAWEIYRRAARMGRGRRFDLAG